MLQLPRVYKFIGFGLVGVSMLLLLWWSTRLQNKQEANRQREVVRS